MKWEMDLKNWNFHGEPPMDTDTRKDTCLLSPLWAPLFYVIILSFYFSLDLQLVLAFSPSLRQLLRLEKDVWKALRLWVPARSVPPSAGCTGSSLMSLGVTPHPSAISCAIRKCEQNKCLSHRSHRSITSPVKSTWGSWGSSFGPVCQLWVCVVFCLVDVFYSARVVCARQVVYHWATLSGQFKSSLTQR